MFLLVLWKPYYQRMRLVHLYAKSVLPPPTTSWTIILCSISLQFCATVRSKLARAESAVEGLDVAVSSSDVEEHCADLRSFHATFGSIMDRRRRSGSGAAQSCQEIGEKVQAVREIFHSVFGV